jgi:hypothetical protein
LFVIVGVTIEFEFPEEYPLVIPIIKIKGEKDLDPADIPDLMKIATEEVTISGIEKKSFDF